MEELAAATEEGDEGTRRADGAEGEGHSVGEEKEAEEEEDLWSEAGQARLKHQQGCLGHDGMRSTPWYVCIYIGL